MMILKRNYLTHMMLSKCRNGPERWSMKCCSANDRLIVWIETGAVFKEVRKECKISYTYCWYFHHYLPSYSNSYNSLPSSFATGRLDHSPHSIRPVWAAAVRFHPAYRSRLCSPHTANSWTLCLSNDSWTASVESVRWPSCSCRSVSSCKANRTSGNYRTRVADRPACFRLEIEFRHSDSTLSTGPDTLRRSGV